MANFPHNVHVGNGHTLVFRLNVYDVSVIGNFQGFRPKELVTKS